MNKKGFVISTLLYPLLVLFTGILAVFLSTNNLNKAINNMKLDISDTIFDSVSCDCEVINNTLKKHSEEIGTIEKTIETLKTDLENIKKVGDAKAEEILSGKTALVKGNKVTGTMTNNSSSSNVKNDAAWHYNSRIYFGIDSGYYPSASYGGMSGVSEKYISYSSLASVIGLTSDKLISGTSILGVSGSIPSRSGSSTASQVSMGSGGLYMVFPYGYYPAENHFSQTSSSEVYASLSDVASALGITANKIAKGQSIAGIIGTYTSDATATASQILSGATAYVNGSKITGTMANHIARTPAQSINYSSGDIYVSIPQGAYITNAPSGYPEITLNASDLGITADKIAEGESIAGVVGTYNPFGEMKYIGHEGVTVQGKRITWYGSDKDDKVETSFSSTTLLSSSSGTENNDTGTSNTARSYFVWEFDVDNTLFTKSEKIKLLLYAYGTDEEFEKTYNGETIYTSLCSTGSGGCIDVIPEITIYKAKDGIKIYGFGTSSRTSSNVDYWENYYKYSCSGSYFLDQSIFYYSGFSAYYSNGKITLIYEAYKEIHNQKDGGSGCTAKDVKTDAQREAVNNWYSNDNSGWYYEGTNAAGTREWYAKGEKDSEVWQYGTPRMALKTKAKNNWYIDIGYLSQ